MSFSSQYDYAVEATRDSLALLEIGKRAPTDIQIKCADSAMALLKLAADRLSIGKRDAE